MSNSQAAEAILALLDGLCRIGDINRFIQVIEEHWHSLWMVRQDLVEEAINMIKAAPSVISPETKARLDSIARMVDHADLLKTVSAIGRKKYLPQAEIGLIWFPACRTTHCHTTGHVVGLRVTDRGTDELRGERLELLDDVGSAVYASLRTRLSFNGFLPWNPDQFYYRTSNLFGQKIDVDGSSLALPLALALYSHAFQVPIPGNLSASANIRRDDGQIEGVESIGEKLEAIQRERYFVKEVLVAHSQRDLHFSHSLTIRKCKHIADALQRVFGASFPPDLARFTGSINVENEAQALQRLYNCCLYNTCIENVTAMIRYLEQGTCQLPRLESMRALFTAYWRRGSCYCHRGDADRSLADHMKAQEMSARHRGIVRPDEYLSSQINLAVLLKDLFRYREAEVVHRRVAVDLSKGRGTDRERIKNESSWSQLCLAMGRFEEAEARQLLSISFNRKGSDLHRNYNYLGQIYTRWGFFSQAKAAFDKAHKSLLSAATHLEKKRFENDQAFIDLYRAEYLYRYGKTLKKKRDVLKHLNGINADNKIGEPWVRSLTWKWIALGFLWDEKTAHKGITLLAKAISYFARQSKPMLKLLEATVRAERALHFLSLEEELIASKYSKRSVIKEVVRILSCIDVDTAVSKYLRREKNTLKEAVQSRKASRESICKALQCLCEKIPY